MIKTCICACSGKRISRDEALRFVASPDQKICLDLGFDLSGQDLIVAQNEGLIPIWNNKSFFEEKFAFEIDLETIRVQMLRQFHHKILTFIALAKKSGKVQLGKKQVEFALKGKSDNSWLIIQAHDASQREKFKKNDQYNLIEIFNSNELAAALGKEKLYYLFVEGELALKITKFAKIYKLLKEYK